MRMPFGKHKGEQIEDLPDSYLRWMAENLQGDLAQEAETQLQLREGRGVVRKSPQERFD